MEYYVGDKYSPPRLSWARGLDEENVTAYGVLGDEYKPPCLSWARGLDEENMPRYGGRSRPRDK